jgi:hypothetical protein
MVLKDFKRSGSKAAAVYTVSVSDNAGNADYRIDISGPQMLVEAALKKATFEVHIDPAATQDDAGKRIGDIFAKHKIDLADRTRKTTTGEFFDTPKLTAATARNSVVVRAYRTRGAGTFWLFGLPLLFTTRFNMFFVLPPICNCFGILNPAMGDPDLFLTSGSVTGPLLASSTRAGLATDSVAFGPPICWPWQEFVPVFRVSPFKVPSAAHFTWGGFGVFP